MQLNATQAAQAAALVARVPRVPPLPCIHLRVQSHLLLPPPQRARSLMAPLGRLASSGPLLAITATQCGPGPRLRDQRSA
jgi:hypothetical protein